MLRLLIVFPSLLFDPASLNNPPWDLWTPTFGGGDLSKLPILPPGPCLPLVWVSGLRQPVFPAADFQLLSVRARMAWGELNNPMCSNLPKPSQMCWSSVTPNPTPKWSHCTQLTSRAHNDSICPMSDGWHVTQQAHYGTLWAFLERRTMGETPINLEIDSKCPAQRKSKFMHTKIGVFNWPNCLERSVGILIASPVLRNTSPNLQRISNAQYWNEKYFLIWRFLKKVVLAGCCKAPLILTEGLQSRPTFLYLASLMCSRSLIWPLQTPGSADFLLLMLHSLVLWKGKLYHRNVKWKYPSLVRRYKVKWEFFLTNES